jgi:hypothetical protein
MPLMTFGAAIADSEPCPSEVAFYDAASANVWGAP